MSSVKEILADNTFSKLANTVRVNAPYVLDELARMDPGRRRDNTNGINTPLPPEAKEAVKHMARHWNVSVASVTRFALRELMEKYHYDASSILTERDHTALLRYEKSRKPLTTFEQSEKKRDRRRSIAEHFRVDDAPRT